MIFIKTLISVTLAGVGVYILTHVSEQTSSLQSVYIKRSQKIQDKKGFGSYLFFNNPETWQTPFAVWMFKLGIIFLGTMLLIGAYPIAFGPIIL